MSIENNEVSDNKPDSKQEFQLELIQPFSTFTDGKPTPIPYVVAGLFTKGGLSAFGSKPKQGKSSFSRYEAVCIAKGEPILGRETERGEVLMVSLEDPREHVDNCLRVLGYDLKKDALIQIVQKLPDSIEGTCEVLAGLFSKRPDIRFVTMDTLAKVLRVNDLNDYMQTMKAAEQLHKLAREFPHLHIQVLAHNKKAETADPFDSILGSTALRGEPDTNIVIFKVDGKHAIQTETRVGKNIEPCLLLADVVESAGADVVRSFSLGETLDDWRQLEKDKKETKKAIDYEQKIIDFLMDTDTRSAGQKETLQAVQGNAKNKLRAIHNLRNNGVVTATGKPLILHLNENQLSTNNFVNEWDGRLQ